VKIRDQAFINAFGLHVKTLRLAKGLSQRDLAALADISHQQIERVENGKVNVTLSTMIALAEALETTFRIGKGAKL
jgi:transcriptional regulator with XRE-family HTH domain